MYSQLGQLLVQTVPKLSAMDEPATTTPTENVLFTIDLILAILAGLVLIWGVMVQRRKAEGLSLAEAPARPNTIFEDAVALSVAFYLIAVLLLSYVVDAANLNRDGAAAMLVIGSGAQVVGLVVCLLIASRRFEGGVRAFLSGLPESRPKGRWGMALCIAFVGIGVCPVLAYLTQPVVTWIDPTFVPPQHPTLSALEHGQSVMLTVGLWLGAAVVAPVAEECFFRGFLQTMLVGITGRRWSSIVMVSLVFGLVHYPQPQAVAALVFLSLLLGYAYERTGSLAAPIAVHALFNLKTLVWEAIALSAR